MSTKDYKRIARALNISKASRAVILAVSLELRQDNPRFDSSTFLLASDDSASLHEAKTFAAEVEKKKSVFS